MPPFWTLGSLYGASAVMLGAFGAHGLKKHISDPGRLANWNTASHYQACFPHQPMVVETNITLR